LAQAPSDLLDDAAARTSLLRRTLTVDKPVEYFILTPERVRAGKKQYGSPPRATLYMAQAK
jgi:hypothetical protein